MLHIERFSVTAAGANGSAVGSWTSTNIIQGYLAAVYIDYTTASFPATTDVTITDNDHTITLFTATDYNTSGLIAPRLGAVGTTNSAITNSHALIPVSGRVKVAVAGGDAGVLTGYLFIEDGA